MNEVFKKMFFTSLGMAVLSKAKMEEFAKDYAKTHNKTYMCAIPDASKEYNKLKKQKEKL